MLPLISAAAPDPCVNPIWEGMSVEEAAKSGLVTCLVRSAVTLNCFHHLGNVFVYCYQNE